MKLLWIFIVFANSLRIYYGYRPQTITILISRRNADSKLVYWIYFVSSTRFSLIRQVWPYFDLWWSLITQIDLESPRIWIIHKILSWNICIWYTFWLSGQIWPEFDGFDRNCTFDDFKWPELTSNNLEFEFSIKFWVEKYVFLVYFD